MARKTKNVVITGEGRDQGKTFLLTEKSALASERWAQRAAFAFARSGRNEVPDDLVGAGAAGLLQIGLRALVTMDFADAEPLLDEMLSCVDFVPDPSKIDQVTRNPIIRPVRWDDDVEEVSTLLILRNEVIELHLGFSIAAFLSTLGEKAKAALSNFNDTSTSPNQSETSSAPVSPPSTT